MVTTPRCLPWWQTTVIYQLYPRSFMDSDGDGNGDLKGIEDNMEYFKELGVKAVWINPIYVSPKVDNGYDVSNYYEIDPMYGDMTDFDRLLLSLKREGMKVIMDFIPNHSSDEHEWFNKSRQSKDNDFKSHYIWADPKNSDGDCPNNWRSVWGGSAWTYEERRNQYYLHQFDKSQPDLNWRNDEVKAEFDNILDFWLKKGVDGFRVSAVQLLLETDNYSLDEQPSGTNDCLGFENDEYCTLHHNLTKEYEGVHDIVKSWRSGEMNHYSTTGAYRFLTVEAYDDVDVAVTYYGESEEEGEEEANFPHHLNFLQIGDELSGGTTSGKQIEELVLKWIDAVPEGRHPNFLLGNHDRSRIASRLGPDFARVCHVLLLTLPGTPTTYYGEEIGMVDLTGYEDKSKFEKRDRARSPMQWSDEVGAGFSNSSDTWLRIGDDYKEVNVKALREQPDSIFNLYRELVALRNDNERVIPVGKLKTVLVDNDIFSYTMDATLDGYNRYLITTNFGPQLRTNLDFHALDESIPIEAPIVISSNMNRNGQIVQTNAVDLASGEGLVIQV
ncbi:amino acid transporter heavy chain SLC3A1-like [Saccoglossus kowalevskii]